MFLNVDLSTRRSAPWPEATLAALHTARGLHAAMPRPEWVGRRIAMPVLDQ